MHRSIRSFPVPSLCHIWSRHRWATRRESSTWKIHTRALVNERFDMSAIHKIMWRRICTGNWSYTVWPISVLPWCNQEPLMSWPRMVRSAKRILIVQSERIHWVAALLSGVSLLVTRRELATIRGVGMASIWWQMQQMSVLKKVWMLRGTSQQPIMLVTRVPPPFLSTTASRQSVVSRI